MEVKEFYTRIGGDAASVLDRLGTEELIVRFVRKFPADGSYTQLCEAIAQGDVETAFRAAHTLKGLCLNLGFESLYRVDAALTEEQRAGKLAEAAEQLPAVKEKYEELVGLIAQL